MACLHQTKPQMAGEMIRRAQRGGIEADYLLADAWFGTKAIIAMAGEQHLTPIVRKKSR
jgi:SRSO17 transposase